MACQVGDYEKQLLKLGHIVATIVGNKFRCWQCEKGELTLTRILKNGQVSEAQFICDSCDDAIGIYPDKGGGVQPSLKINMRGKGFSADEPGRTTKDDGRWR